MSSTSTILYLDTLQHFADVKTSDLPSRIYIKICNQIERTLKQKVKEYYSHHEDYLQLAIRVTFMASVTHVINLAIRLLIIDVM